SGEVGDAELAEDGRGRGASGTGRRAGNGIESSQSSQGRSEDYHRDFAPHRKYHLPDESHGAAHADSAGNGEADVAGGPGGPDGAVGGRRRRAEARARASSDGHAEDDQGSGGGRYGLRREAGRSADCGKPALRVEPERPASATAGGKTGAGQD